MTLTLFHDKLPGLLHADHLYIGINDIGEVRAWQVTCRHDLELTNDDVFVVLLSPQSLVDMTLTWPCTYHWWFPRGPPEPAAAAPCDPWTSCGSPPRAPVAAPAARGQHRQVACHTQSGAKTLRLQVPYIGLSVCTDIVNEVIVRTANVIVLHTIMVVVSKKDARGRYVVPWSSRNGKEWSPFMQHLHVFHGTTSVLWLRVNVCQWLKWKMEILYKQYAFSVRNKIQVAQRVTSTTYHSHLK